MKLQGVTSVGEAPDAQAQEKVPGAAGQPGAQSGGAETLDVPYRCPPSGQGVLGQDSAREGRALCLERGEPAIRGIPLSSDRTFTSHMESQFWVPRQCPLGVREVQPKPTLQNPLLPHEGCQKCPLSPQGCPPWRDGPCSRRKHRAFLEIVTRGAASAALDAACCSQRRA